MLDNSFQVILFWQSGKRGLLCSLNCITDDVVVGILAVKGLVFYFFHQSDSLTCGGVWTMIVTINMTRFFDDNPFVIVGQVNAFLTSFGSFCTTANTFIN